VDFLLFDNKPYLDRLLALLAHAKKWIIRDKIRRNACLNYAKGRQKEYPGLINHHFKAITLAWAGLYI